MEVRGWASTPDLDYYRHIIEPGAFDESIRQKGLDGPKGIKFLAFHDANRPLGYIKTLETRERKLWMEAEVLETISYGADIAAATKANDGLNFSVGFYVLDADIKKDRDGREYLHILRGDLEEVSVVVFPGNANAVMVKQSKDSSGDPDLDKALAGFALATLLVRQHKTNPTAYTTQLVRALEQGFRK